MASKGTLKFTLKPTDYHWLTQTYEKGTLVYLYTGQTFGAVSARGVAVSLEPNKTPFFEVPKSAVKWDEK